MRRALRVTRYYHRRRGCDRYRCCILDRDNRELGIVASEGGNDIVGAQRSICKRQREIALNRGPVSNLRGQIEWRGHIVLPAHMG